MNMLRIGRHLSSACRRVKFRQPNDVTYAKWNFGSQQGSNTAKWCGASVVGLTALASYDNKGTWFAECAGAEDIVGGTNSLAYYS